MENTNQKKNDINNESMTKQEAWNYKEFISALTNNMLGMRYYNPFTQNQNLVELNNDPLVPTYEKILTALSNQPNQYKELCGYSQFMEVAESIYGKTLKYFESLLSMDLYWTVSTKDPTKDFNSEEYKKDLKRVYKFFDSFDYKQEFRKVVKEILRKETVYTFFRDSEEIDAPIDIESENSSRIKKSEKFGLQILPQKYCKLTGYCNNSMLLFDFDMNYFLQGSTDINLYAPSFKRKFKELFSDNTQSYDPSNGLSNRNGTFALYTQQSPQDGAYAFKMDVSNFRQTPPFASLMKDCFRNTEIEQFQYDKDALSARAFIAGTIRLFDNAKSGTNKNQFAIDPTTLGALMSLVANSLKNKVQPLAMPVEDNKFFQFSDGNNLMVENSNINGARKGASASSLIYTNDKMMQFEVQLATEFDYQYMAHNLYSQFANFLNYFVNRKTTKYKFTFELDGCDRLFYREQKQKQLEQMFSNGLIPNTSYIASCYGIKPQAFDRMLDESKNGDLQNKLSMLLNKNVMKGNGDNGTSNEVGNPKKDSTDLAQGGAISRDYQ